MSDSDSISDQIEMINLNDKQSSPKTVNIQVEIRLNKKVPKRIINDRLADLNDFLQQHKNSARNWRSLECPDNSNISTFNGDFSDKTTPFDLLFDKITIGSCQKGDGEALECVLGSFVASTSNVHAYRLNSDGPLSQSVGDDDENIVGSQLWQLPCIEFENIWENLIYDSDLKNEIMSYVYALMHLSERGVNSKIINVNRLILLTGPPGTGKTSLCKGLAQHLAIRLNDRYSHSVLVEINSHSLFSKWFSESGKLVQKMFDQIDELAEDSKCMVFVLIDEVESLGMCRESSSSRSEPADAIRAVNALLTQIDRVRRRENVLILCTSNLESSLDRALVDRADIVKNVGQPSTYALYAILKSCITEMIRIDVVDTNNQLLPEDINCAKTHEFNESTKRLLGIAKQAHGLSGRAISMLPTLIYSKSLEDCIPLDQCLELLSEVVQERKSREK